MRRRLSLSRWIAIVVTGILAMLNSLLSNIGATAFTWFSPWVALALLLLLVSFGFPLWQNRQQLDSEILTMSAGKNRRIMLERVRIKWITGFLENRLYYDENLLPLELRKHVGSRWDLVLHNPLASADSLTPGTTILQVFDQSNGELLVLGAPGSGKTTLLLELARELIQRAKGNEEHPLPVVLMLSSWATKQLPIEQWVVEELRIKYQIPLRIGQEWVDSHQLLLLLDGLDEVPLAQQPACIDALNNYQHEAQRQMVVCTRVMEYLTQPQRLSIRTAVTIQALSHGKINRYLAALGEEVDGLKNALEQSETLRQLVTTPLLLKVLILTYHGKPEQELLVLTENLSDDRQHQLFYDYVQRMLQRKGPHLHASIQQSERWLAWFAQQLTQHNQTDFYLEQMQPDWLSEGRPHALYRNALYLLIWLLLGPIFIQIVRPSFEDPDPTFMQFLSSGLIKILLIWPIIAVCIWLIGRKRLTRERSNPTKRSLTYTLRNWNTKIFGADLLKRLYKEIEHLGTRVFNAKIMKGKRQNTLGKVQEDPFTDLLDTIEPSEVITLSWKNAMRWRFLGMSLLGGILGGLFIAFNLHMPLGGPVLMQLFTRVGLWPTVFIVILVVTLLTILLTMLTGSVSSTRLDNTARITPNRGIRDSLRNGLLFGSLIWPIASFFSALIFPVLYAVVFGLLIALILALYRGGLAWLQHMTLRLLLWRMGYTPAPWHYVDFLDDAADQLLLRKVGGGYIFRHRLLQDYFASLQNSTAH